MAVLSHAQLQALWVAQGGTPASSDLAAAIAQAESGGDTSRINNTAYPNRPGYHAPGPGAQPEYSVGLWQVNMLAHPSYSEASLLTQAGNARAAVAISSQGSSFTAWSTFTNGAYRAYLSSGGTPPPGPVGPAGTPGVPRPHNSINGFANLTSVLARDYPRALRSAAKMRRSARRVLR